MRVIMRDMANNKTNVWVEDWLPKATDWVVVSEAVCIIAGDKCLIDTIDTPPQFRGCGYATAIVKELQKYFKSVAPIGVRREAIPFWDKLGMRDALGTER